VSYMKKTNYRVVAVRNVGCTIVADYLRDSYLVTIYVRICRIVGDLRHRRLHLLRYSVERYTVVSFSFLKQLASVVALFASLKTKLFNL